MSLIELELPSGQMRHEDGHCWMSALPDEVALGDTFLHPANSPLLVFEDGHALGPAHSSHGEIRSAGSGLFSHWSGTLYFSTSDNADPRSSGRRYTVRGPRATLGSPQESRDGVAAAFRALAAEPHNYDTLSDGEVEAAIDLARTTMDGILAFVPEEERSTEAFRLCNKLTFLKGAAFEKVSGFPRSSPAFDDAIASTTAQYRTGTAVHLELGTYIAWPDEKIDAHIAAQQLGDFIRLDMNAAFPLDLAASVTALPFADETIDSISSNSLFEHVAYPHEIIKEAFRVLRPGGAFVTTVPFHFVAHGCPADYLRYTGQFFEEVCGAAGFAPVLSDTWATSGVYYTTHQLLKGLTARSPERTRTGRGGQMAHLTMMALLAAIQGFDDHMDGGGANHFHATRAVAVKPGPYVPPPAAPDRTRPFLERYAHALICPATGLPLRQMRGALVSLDGSRSYEVIDGVPNLFVLQGFGSSFINKASSRERLAEWTGRKRRLFRRLTQR